MKTEFDFFIEELEVAHERHHDHLPENKKPTYYQLINMAKRARGKWLQQQEQAQHDLDAAWRDIDPLGQG